LYYSWSNYRIIHCKSYRAKRKLAALLLEVIFAIVWEISWLLPLRRVRLRSVKCEAPRYGVTAPGGRPPIYLLLTKFPRFL